MQQYRVNFVLLIVLFVVGVIGASAAYGLWRFQMTRHADTLFEAANKAEEEGDVRTVVQYLSSYVSFRPDDMAARVKLSNAFADLTELDDVSFEEMGKALRVLEDSVRNMPEEKELQLRLVKLYGKVGRTRDSLDHLGYMLDNDPDNGELLVLKTQYLMQARSDNEAIESAYQVIGYDKKSDTFDAKKAKAPDSVTTYSSLGALLHAQRDQVDMADRVMDQMIEANPDSAEAYLMRGRYFMTFGQEDRGEQDIDQAYGLDPDNADVLLAKAELETNRDQDAKARKFLEKGQAKYPDDNRFYQSLAMLEMKNKDYEKAMAHVDEGLAAIKGRKVQLLIVFKSDLQLRANDIEGVRESIEKMREFGFRPQYIDWTEARILLSEGKWYEASEALSRLRADTGGIGDLTNQINFQLAFCYEQLGRNDRARDAYKLVLQQSPDNDPAAAGLQRVMAKLGQRGIAAGNSEQVQSWQQSVIDEMNKPEDQRNWATIDKRIQKSIAEKNIDDVSQKLIWANLYLIRGDLDKSRQLLQEVHKLVPEDKADQRLMIQRLATQLVLRDPEQGPAKALGLVDKSISQYGDQPALRLDKADMLIALRGEDLPQKLSQLSEGIDGWTDDQKLTLWNGLASKYLAVGMSKEAKECLLNVANLQPDNLPTRRMLFMLALETNDDVGMKEAQEKILEVTRDKSDSLWEFTEARRHVVALQRGRLDKDVLPEIRVLIQKALDQRPDWHDLFLARAELELVENDQDAAMRDYTQAEELGPVAPAARLQLIRLLGGWSVSASEGAGREIQRGFTSATSWVHSTRKFYSIRATLMPRSIRRENSSPTIRTTRQISCGSGSL